MIVGVLHGVLVLGQQPLYTGSFAVAAAAVDDTQVFVQAGWYLPRTDPELDPYILDDELTVDSDSKSLSC